MIDDQSVEYLMTTTDANRIQTTEREDTMMGPLIEDHEKENHEIKPSTSDIERLKKTFWPSSVSVHKEESNESLISLSDKESSNTKDANVANAARLLDRLLNTMGKI